MSQAQAAAGPDRLPWLADEPAPPRKRSRKREAAGWAAGAAILLVAGISYWMGAHSWPKPVVQAGHARPETTVPLPQPRMVEPQQPQVVLQPPPQVSPVPAPEVPLSRPRVESHAAEPQPSVTTTSEAASASADEKTAESAQTEGVKASTETSQAAPKAVDKPLTAWPAWQSEGAEGRIVRIGAFGTRLQAKLGWRYMVEAYPAVSHLKATVVSDRNSRGQQFYRFQIGTTSQAHSEVLCQRMEEIHLSCAVVGLPWKPKGVER